MLEWVAMLSPSGSFQPRDQTQVSCIAGKLFQVWATREAMLYKFYTEYSARKEDGGSSLKYIYLKRPH